MATSPSRCWRWARGWCSRGRAARSADRGVPARPRARADSWPPSRCRDRATPRAFGFLKVSRVKPKGVSVLSIAAYLPRDGGRIRGARVAYGAMGPTPLRAQGVERVLEGAVARRRDHRPRRGGRGRWDRAADRRHRHRLVPQGGGGRASPPPSRTDGARLMAKRPVELHAERQPPRRLRRGGAEPARTSCAGASATSRPSTAAARAPAGPAPC